MLSTLLDHRPHFEYTGLLCRFRYVTFETHQIFTEQSNIYWASTMCQTLWYMLMIEKDTDLYLQWVPSLVGCDKWSIAWNCSLPPKNVPKLALNPNMSTALYHLYTFFQILSNLRPVTYSQLSQSCSMLQIISYVSITEYSPATRSFLPLHFTDHWILKID